MCKEYSLVDADFNTADRALGWRAPLRELVKIMLESQRKSDHSNVETAGASKPEAGGAGGSRLRGKHAAGSSSSTSKQESINVVETSSR
ncbi:unnamed protein product, partial [Amoebophrya sp. A25]|eukprot:GSA25T00005339001.1